LFGPIKDVVLESNSPQAEMFHAKHEHASQLLQQAYKDYNLMIKFLPNIKETAEKFTWDLSVQKILSLIK
jgi:hypothetical protein